MTELFMFTF